MAVQSSSSSLGHEFHMSQSTATGCYSGQICAFAGHRCTSSGYVDAYCVRGKEGKLGAYAVKRVTAGAHFPTHWLFEPAQRPDDRADNCMGCSFLPSANTKNSFFTAGWTATRPLAGIVGRRGLGLMSASDMGHLAMPINSVA